MLTSYPEDIQALFGARVRKLRERMGVSQEELAHRAGLDRSYLGQVERGERNVSLQNIYKISTGLACSPQDLFNDKDASGGVDVPR